MVEGENLILTRQDDRLLIQIMAISTGTLGVLLASLSDPAELEDSAASHAGLRPVRCRGDGPVEVRTVATRYPLDHSVVFLAKIRLPTATCPSGLAPGRSR